MKIIDCIQGSAEWLAARRGIPTASRFADIVTPEGKPRKGETPRKYALELVGERLTGLAQPHMVTAAMERGTMLEGAARSWYEMFTGNTVTEVGFLLADGGRWGASPDGITDTGGIEIKCPLRLAFLDMLESGGLTGDYMTQVQACMWVSGRSHWDFVLYSDESGIPSQVWPVARDEKMHAGFAEAIPAFCERVDEITERIGKL